MAEAQACETLDKISKLQMLLKGLNRTVGGKRARFAKIFNEELIRLRSAITVALSQSEGPVSDPICVCETVSL